MNGKRIAMALGLASTTGVAVAAITLEDAPLTSTECATVLGSDVCTWVVMEQGQATELGASIPIALIEAVPTDVEMVWPPVALANVSFPVEARRALGIDHLGLNWEAHGHPPTSFLTQHFDFHFYSVSEHEIASIDCVDEAKPDVLPGSYALPDIDVPGMGRFVGLCVPAMGMHAMPAGEVDDVDPFEATMMVGYYGSEPIFFEPMVARDLLLRRADFTLPMPAVHGLPEGVRYPREFRAEYDDGSEVYRLIFAGFDQE